MIVYRKIFRWNLQQQGKPRIGLGNLSHIFAITFLVGRTGIRDNFANDTIGQIWVKFPNGFPFFDNDDVYIFIIFQFYVFNKSLYNDFS